MQTIDDYQGHGCTERWGYLQLLLAVSSGSTYTPSGR
jgi:hypothetical protein